MKRGVLHGAVRDGVVRRSGVRALVLCAVVATSALGCGGKNKRVAAFAADWQSDRGKSINAVYDQLRGAKLPAGTALAVGVTQAGLRGLTLDGKNRWSYSHALDSRPFISGDVVVGTGDNSVFCLDAQSGKELWKTSSEGLRLRGAGDNGTLTAVSLGSEDVTQNRLLVLNRQGQTLLDLEPTVPIGIPAVLGGIVFIPWGDQYVSAIDIAQGNEAGRLLSRSQVSHATNIGGQLFFGERGLIPFNEKIADVSRDPAQVVTVPDGKLPGNPQWLLPGTRVTPKAASALDKVRLYARPNAAGNAVEGNRFAATYFRLALGMDTDSAAVRWVHTSKHDYLGAAAAVGGFVFCDAAGNVSVLGAAAGDPSSQFSFGTTLTACVVQTAAFAVTPQQQAAPLYEQLEASVLLDAPQLVTAQRFLLAELHKLEDPKVTQTLIRLATHPRTAPALLQDARTLLAARRNGAEFMLTALASHYDFLGGVLTAPPVGPLADALAAMGEKRAAPLLANHLNDPADSSDDVLRAARALEKLATPAEYDALKTFFTLYRAAANEPHLIDAVIAVAKAMLEVGGEDGRSAVAFASRNALTQARVREGIAPLLQD